MTLQDPTTPDQLGYFGHPYLGKADKGVLRSFPCKITGLSRAQMTRPIDQNTARPGVSATAGERPSSQSSVSAHDPQPNRSCVCSVPPSGIP